MLNNQKVLLPNYLKPFEKETHFFQRKGKKTIKSKFYPINKINKLDKKKLIVIKNDLKNIISIRKKLFNFDFKGPKIMGDFEFSDLNLHQQQEIVKAVSKGATRE